MEEEKTPSILSFCRAKAGLALFSNEAEQKAQGLAKQMASELAPEDVKIVADEIEVRFRYYVADALQRNWGKSLTERLDRNTKQLSQAVAPSHVQRLEISDAIFQDGDRSIRMRTIGDKTEYCSKIQLSEQERILNGSKSTWGFGLRLLSSNEQQLEDESRVRDSIKEGKLINKENRHKKLLSVLLSDWGIRLEFSQVDQCHELEMELIHKAGSVVTHEILYPFLFNVSLLLMVLVFAK